MTDKAKQTEQVVEQVQQAQKTWPDVADKTVDKVSDMVVAIRDTLTSSSGMEWSG